MMNLKKSNPLAAYAFGLAWGYSMCKANSRAKKREKKGKTIDIAKLIGMTWEEYYRLCWNIGVKLGEVVEDMVVGAAASVDSKISTLRDDVDDSTKRIDDIIDKLRAKNQPMSTDTEGEVEAYVTKDGRECLYLVCTPESCERRTEIGCMECVHDVIPTVCNEDNNTLRSCPRFNRNPMGCEGCSHQMLNHDDDGEDALY